MKDINSLTKSLNNQRSMALDEKEKTKVDSQKAEYFGAAAAQHATEANFMCDRVDFIADEDAGTGRQVKDARAAADAATVKANLARSCAADATKHANSARASAHCITPLEGSASMFARYIEFESSATQAQVEEAWRKVEEVRVAKTAAVEWAANAAAAADRAQQSGQAAQTSARAARATADALSASPPM